MKDAKVSQWLELTAPLISKRVFGKLYDQALALLTAHRLKMAGYGDNSYGTVGDVPSSLNIAIWAMSTPRSSVTFPAWKPTNTRLLENQGRLC